MTSPIRHLLAGLVAVGSVCAASSAHAQLYGLTSFNHEDVGVTINVPGKPSENTLANSFVTSLSNSSSGPATSSIETYCIDIYHPNNGHHGDNNSSYQEVRLITSSTYDATRDNPNDTSTYGAGGLGRAAWFVNNTTTLAAQTPGGVLDKPALQLAIWKAEYETQADTGNYASLGAGTISFSTDPMSQVGKDAIAYLTASLAAGTAPNGTSSYATSIGTWVSYQGGAQDQIFDPKFSPVPEPASMAMCATALVGLTGVAARRKQKAKAAKA